jgi:hypothetical protein
VRVRARTDEEEDDEKKGLEVEESSLFSYLISDPAVKGERKRGFSTITAASQPSYCRLALFTLFDSLGQ